MKAKYYPHVTLLIAGTLSVCPVALMAIYQGIRTNSPAGSDVIADFTESPPLQQSAVSSSLSVNPTTTTLTQSNADRSNERSPETVVAETVWSADESGSTLPEANGEEPPLHLPSLSSLYSSPPPSTESEAESTTASESVSTTETGITMADNDPAEMGSSAHSPKHPRQAGRLKAGDTRRSNSAEKKQDEMPAEPAVPEMRIASLDPRGQLSGLPAVPAAADRTSRAQVREDPAILEEVVIQTPREGHPVAQIEDVIAGTNARGWPVVLVRSDLPDDLWWVQQGAGIQRNTFAARVNFGNTRSLSGTSYRLVVVFLDSQDEMMRFRLARQFKELPEGLRRSREFRYTRN